MCVFTHEVQVFRSSDWYPAAHVGVPLPAGLISAGAAAGRVHAFNLRRRRTSSMNALQLFKPQRKAETRRSGLYHFSYLNTVVSINSYRRQAQQRPRQFSVFSREESQTGVLMLGVEGDAYVLAGVIWVDKEEEGSDYSSTDC